MLMRRGRSRAYLVPAGTRSEVSVGKVKLLNAERAVYKKKVVSGMIKSDI